MINTSLRSGTEYFDIDQRFPTPQKTLFIKVSSEQEIPTSWVYGLIRQESRFMLTVSSTVGARGLMQIMPSTAQWLAKKTKIK
ncbi:soluble lytic murein transglycosylase [gut metagenome]|uniref:Soluble lytic murein transglycosylase n=1 Tax=gut metagenome TaxID=749906 RepID=J9GJ62_9ZZZZ